MQTGNIGIRVRRHANDFQSERLEKPFSRNYCFKVLWQFPMFDVHLDTFATAIHRKCYTEYLLSISE